MLRNLKFAFIALKLLNDTLKKLLDKLWKRPNLQNWKMTLTCIFFFQNIFLTAYFLLYHYIKICTYRKKWMFVICEKTFLIFRIYLCTSIFIKTLNTISRTKWNIPHTINLFYRVNINIYKQKNVTNILQGC